MTKDNFLSFAEGFSVLETMASQLSNNATEAEIEFRIQMMKFSVQFNVEHVWKTEANVLALAKLALTCANEQACNAVLSCASSAIKYAPHYCGDEIRQTLVAIAERPDFVGVSMRPEQTLAVRAAHLYLAATANRYREPEPAPVGKPVPAAAKRRFDI